MSMTATLSGPWRSALALFCLVGVCGAIEITSDMDPADKNAWSENAGWLNFASTNGNTRLHFAGTNGYLSGYAWSENLGWVKLGANTNGPYSNDSATNWGVNLTNATGSLAGYAWGENAGWIKFNPAHGGVQINTTNGQFRAMAWGENIGWICFQGSATDYLVRTRAFDTQTNGTPNWWLAHYALTNENDDADSDHVPAWKEYVANTDPHDASSYLRIVALSNQPSMTVYFYPSSSLRYYTLARRDDLQSGTWTNVTSAQGVNGLATAQDPGATTQGFYRIEAKVNP